MWNTKAIQVFEVTSSLGSGGERFRYDMVRYVKNIVDPEQRTAELDF